MNNILKTLPIEGKRIFLRAYDKALKQTSDETKSYNLALSVLERKYKKKGKKWIVKSSVSVYSDIKKSGVFNPNLKFTAILSSNKVDYDNNSVTDYLLRYLSDTNRVDNNGDFDHYMLSGKTNYKGVFKKVNHFYKDGKVYLNFIVNKSHDKFNEVKNLFKGKKLAELSAEFYNPVLKNNKIISASSMGWSVCKDQQARNPDAKIINTKEI